MFLIYGSSIVLPEDMYSFSRTDYEYNAFPLHLQ